MTANLISLTDDPQPFHNATHFLRDGWKQAADNRIAQLETLIAMANDEITAVRQSVAEMTAFTKRVCGMPRLACVEWSEDDQRMAKKLSAAARGDNPEQSEAA